MLLLITGASGVGKSTVRALVEPDLSPYVECVELLDLTSRPSVMSRVWRQQTAETAVRRAVELQVSGRHLLLCGDPVPAAELVAAPSATSLDAIAACLLDVHPVAQAERLAERGDDPALLRHHQAFAEWMRRQATDPLHMTHVVSDGGWPPMRWERLHALRVDWQMHTIDTTDMSSRDVAEGVLDWCRRALNREAPALTSHGHLSDRRRDTPPEGHDVRDPPSSLLAHTRRDGRSGSRAGSLRATAGVAERASGRPGCGPVKASVKDALRDVRQKCERPANALPT